MIPILLNWPFWPIILDQESNITHLTCFYFINCTVTFLASSFVCIYAHIGVHIIILIQWLKNEMNLMYNNTNVPIKNEQ